MLKKLTAAACALTIAAGMAGVPAVSEVIGIDAAVAASAADPTSGTCGQNVTWSLSADGSVLTIKGTGAMADYTLNNSPWRSYTSITVVIVSEGVTRVGNHAFGCCYNIKAVNLPSTIESIGDSAFADCAALEGIRIPDGVRTIGMDAFSHCMSLSAVAMPEKLRTIGAGAFADCYELTNITIPNGVKEIGDRTFRHCHKLEYVEIGWGVKSIGTEAFFDCEALTSLTIPNTVASIVDDCGMELDYYQSVKDGFTICCVKDSAADLYAKKKNIPVIYIEDTTIPGDVDGSGSKPAQTDLSLLQQYVSGWDVIINEAAADVTGDGKVTGEDIALMQKYFAGWNVTLGKK